ncbi:hypothetical protein DF268_36560 [Streptomyces sp. V2]|uniref:hypothetical protein n=1 Tax=Streptomyces sp. V2 TaxID=1424099 RepID=UPI000D66E05F|nr:hypothetical protein [Streptomyces sp. V2]PWG08675.1 hypothetical protein DF268_36560 [Streptomyces sp. V2]
MPSSSRASCGTNACGGGGSFGLSNAFNCVADHEYDCASFVICDAASSRTFSRSAVKAASSADDFEAIPAASGSLWAALAAARFAVALGMSRGMDDWAREIASEACISHELESLLKSLRRSVALARSAAQVRKASAPSPFHATHWGRTFNSFAMSAISAAAFSRRLAAPLTTPAFAWSSHASICS